MLCTGQLSVYSVSPFYYLLLLTDRYGMIGLCASLWKEEGQPERFSIEKKSCFLYCGWVVVTVRMWRLGVSLLELVLPFHHIDP